MKVDAHPVAGRPEDTGMSALFGGKVHVKHMPAVKDII
jgi:hypothetical protein